MPPSFPLTSPPFLCRHYHHFHYHYFMLLPHHLRLRKTLRPRTQQRRHSLQIPQPPHLPDLRPQARPRRQRPLNPPPDPSGDGDPQPHRFSPHRQAHARSFGTLDSLLKTEGWNFFTEQRLAGIGHQVLGDGGQNRRFQSEQDHVQDAGRLQLVRVRG
ncbi:hypothetical protein LINGRAHAP2_LOCUS9914 [Linum grandiflorum]